MGAYRGATGARRRVLAPTSALSVAVWGVVVATCLAGVGLDRSSARPLSVAAASVARTSDWFTSVSCVSQTACTGVGNLSGGEPHAQVMLAERWNGNRWRADRIPSPSKISELNGVSCPSKRTCIAVGLYVRAYNTLHGGYFGSGSVLTAAERWNGRSWSIQHPVNPGGNSVNGSGASTLNAVSCASATSCTAVGYYYFGPTSGTETLAEHWNGHRWSVQKTPASIGLDPSLSAVSCPSMTSCMAVGSTEKKAVAERWNGTKWSRVRLPEPAHSTEAALTAVDCVSRSVCVAVGDFTTDRVVPGAFVNVTGMAERWDGKTWTDQRIRALHRPGRAGALSGYGLSGVSCASAHICMAVGKTTAVQLKGRRWRWAAAGISGGLSGVSCPSKQTCLGAGGVDVVGGGPTGTLAERWNGKHWTRQRTPNPAV